jgi:hypothetical protein
LGQPTSDEEFLMSAFLPIADIQMTACDVRFVPSTDSCTAATGLLLDHFFRAGEQ